jgi:hypothetical protein
MKAVFIVLLSLFLAAEAGASAEWEKREEQVMNLPIEYRSHADACLEKASRSCCMSYTRAMAVGNYQPAIESQCPDGYTKNTQGCTEVSEWCKPEKKGSQ